MTKPIVFIRHRFPPALAEHCERNRLIAIEFNRYCHDNFEDYPGKARNQPGFKTAFRIFRDLAANGGLVVAQYNPKAFYLGRVKAESAIECLERSSVVKDGKKYLDKTLTLTRVKGPYKYADHLVLSALRPPFVTISKLSEYARDSVDHLWSGKKPRCALNNLHPQMLEQMCDEWLRTRHAGKYHIAYQYLATGSTLPTIDIYAQTRAGRTLFVQVTYTKGAKALAKARALKESFEGLPGNSAAIVLFMGPKEIEEDVKEMGLKFVSIESIFDTLYKDPAYKPMLNRMVGIA